MTVADRLTAALDDRYTIERELGRGGIAERDLYYVTPYEGESLPR